LDIIEFLQDLMRKRRRLPSQLAADIGVSHATMHRWLAGKDVPSTSSCRRLAEYSGVSVQKILAAAGHIKNVENQNIAFLPEFREYARQKYPKELDEDVIAMIEDLIERRRQPQSAERATRKPRKRNVKSL
jgi:transcriptional regulator with XRE-family HTH domain